MREFYVQFHSLRDVLEFVTLASKQTVKMDVGNDLFQVNATSFMGLFALNCRMPQRVAVNCDQEKLENLLRIFDRFLVK